MADGSVKEFNDTNGDHFLNPGFQVTTGPGVGTPVSDPTVTGFKDNTMDLPPAEVFSGVFMQDVMQKTLSFLNGPDNGFPAGRWWLDRCRAGRAQRAPPFPRDRNENRQLRGRPG